MKLLINTERQSYSTDRVRTMTVGDLACLLAGYDDNTPVYLAFDGHYTFGGITEENFEAEYDEAEDDE